MIEWYTHIITSVSPLINFSYSSAELIVKLIRPVLRRRAVSIEINSDAEDDWCKFIQGTLRKTVIMQSCSNVRSAKQVFNVRY